MRYLWLLLVPALVQAYPYDWSPGVVDPECTQVMMCVKGYAKKLRPPEEYTEKLKIRQIVEHGIDCSKGCEEDHVIPLELCGHPIDEGNLSPQQAPEFRQKDWVEDDLHKKVCDGSIPLATAQFVVVRQWEKYYRENHPKK